MAAEAFKQLCSPGILSSTCAVFPAKLREKEEEKEDKCSLAEETVNMLKRMEYEYLSSIQLGINEEAAQEKDVEIEYLTEEVFEKLLGSNDLDCNTSMFLADCLLKKEEKKD